MGNKPKGPIVPRSATVVIYQGDDLQKLANLDDAVKRAEMVVREAKGHTSSTRLLSEADPVEDAIEQHALISAERDAFAAEAEERGVTVHLIARPRLRWRELVREHPARLDNDDDKVFGVNMETLPDVLLPESIDLDMSTVEGDVREFLDSLSDYDYYDRLFLSAFSINRGSAVADPTRRLLSASSQT